MPKPLALTDLQIDIMKILWKLGDATVADVHRDLQRKHELAHPTVATLLSRLEKKGAITHKVDGRQFIYSAVAKEADVQRTMIAQIKNSLFTGDVPALVNQLLSGRDISRSDLEEVKALIEEKERELARRAKKPKSR
jgi:BlaI family penicillinase repressor